MPFEKYFHRLADSGPAASGLDRAVQSSLAAVAGFYGVGARVNRLLHENGLRPRHRLRAPVLSVGNITLGGTGKSPFCIWLARFLRQEGRLPAVLTRGYGRRNEDELVVVHDGERLQTGTRRAGDEPVMMARALRRVPVIACSDRFRGGRHAMRHFEVDTFILDDGFQHVALERQGEIVLLDATRPLDDLRVFPRGTLREPLGVLNRAHLLVLTRCDQARGSASMARRLRAQFPHATVVRTRLIVKHLRRLSNGERLDPVTLEGKRVVVACGVGNPGSVRETVKKLGARVVRLDALGDHATVAKETVVKWDSA